MTILTFKLERQTKIGGKLKSRIPFKIKTLRKNVLLFKKGFQKSTVKSYAFKQWRAEKNVG